MKYEKWKFRKIYCTVPENIFLEIKNLQLFSQVDSVVASALEKLVEEEKLKRRQNGKEN